MADANNVLFVRGNGNKNSIDDNEDVWDDSALIKAYDKAVNLAKEEVTKRLGMEAQKPLQSHADKPQKKWYVGSPCRAVYSEDGETYEAIITKIFDNNRTCIVKFVGYGNTEKVEVSTLLESEGLQSQVAQHKDALAEKLNEDNAHSEEQTFPSNPKSKKSYNGMAGEKMDCEAEEAKPFRGSFMPGPSFNSALDMMPPAPPLPPQLMAKLLSWLKTGEN